MKTEFYSTNNKSQGLVTAHFALIIIIVVHVLGQTNYVFSFSIIARMLPRPPLQAIFYKPGGRVQILGRSLRKRGVDQSHDYVTLISSSVRA